MIQDRGDRCLFKVVCCLRLFLNVFPFPVCKAQFIGDWYEYRRGAPITIIFLIIRQFYWRTDAPCANKDGGPNTKKILLTHCVWSALPIGGGGHRCANILAYRYPPRHHYWRTDPPCANSISPVVRIGTPNPLPPRWVRPPLGTGGGAYLLAGEGVGGVQLRGDQRKKILKRGGPSISVRLTYFYSNRLLTGLYKQETEILWRKDDGNIKKQTDIDRHSPVLSLNSSQPPDPLIFHYPLPLIIASLFL